MSTETGTPEDQALREVAALWTQLYTEAIRRRDDLKPATSRRWIAAIIVVAVAMIALIGMGAVWVVEQGQGNADATATAIVVTATAIRAADRATDEASKTAVAGTATADWNILQAHQTQTSVALAETAVAATTEVAKATGTAQVTATAAAIATATAIACLQDDLFSAQVDAVPSLQPAPLHKWVTGTNIEFIGASWTITNTGGCTWDKVTLTQISGPTADNIEVSSDSIPPGGQAKLTIQFTKPPQNPVNGSWVITVNGKPLLSRGGEVSLRIDTWIVAVTPTPTPTLTPTTTPVPHLGNLTAREPKGQRYISEGIIFEWIYDIELEPSYHFQILVISPSKKKMSLIVPGSCTNYSSQGNTHRCPVRDVVGFVEEGGYTWSVEVIDTANQVLRQSDVLSFDLSGQPGPTDTPTPVPTTPLPPSTRGP